MTERPWPVSVPGEGLALEAILSEGAGAGAAVVAPPHPEYGGRCDNPVVLALAQGLGRAGLSTLRFNFRGTGRSDGLVSGDEAAADADYRAALFALQGAAPGPYVAAGYSFGSAAAVRVAASEGAIARLVLVAPPLPLLDVEALGALARPVRVIIGDGDDFSPLPALREALEGMRHVTLHVIEGADHFFFSCGLDRVSELAREAD